MPGGPGSGPGSAPGAGGSPPAWALNDAQQLVVEAWKLVNQSYVDPSQLDEMGWRRLRQKTLEKPINRSTEAYDAIEAMLEPLGDSYTRMLRPSEYAALRSNTKGTVCGVGLQLALGDEEAGIVVIAPLDGSPAAEAGIASGSTVLEVNGESTEALGLDRTAALLRGPSGSEVLIKLRDPDGKLREVILKRRSVDLQPVRSVFSTVITTPWVTCASPSSANPFPSRYARPSRNWDVIKALRG
jgi:carboxyl-terminal processing protease